MGFICCAKADWELEGEKVRTETRDGVIVILGSDDKVLRTLGDSDFINQAAVSKNRLHLLLVIAHETPANNAPGMSRRRVRYDPQYRYMLKVDVIKDGGVQVLKVLDIRTAPVFNEHNLHIIRVRSIADDGATAVLHTGQSDGLHEEYSWLNWDLLQEKILDKADP